MMKMLVLQILAALSLAVSTSIFLINVLPPINAMKLTVTNMMDA